MFYDRLGYYTHHDSALMAIALGTHLNLPNRKAAATGGNTLVLGECFGPERQAAKTFAGRREDGVGHGRSRRRNTWLADSARGFVAGNDVHFDVGRVVDANHRIIIEIALLHLAIRDGDFVEKRRSQTEHHSALDLGFEHVGINDLAAIDGDHDAIDF